MRLPTLLSRRKLNVHKNDFGHVLVLAGSKGMLGAAALCGLSAMRAGAGLVTIGVPESLNSVFQKKISAVIMTLPLKETSEQAISQSAFHQIKPLFSKFNVIAIGPGLTTHPGTRQFILKIIAASPVPLVIDADGLNSLADRLDVLTKTATPKILTPHPGEMSRLIKTTKDEIERNRSSIAKDFVKKYNCTLLLKGHQTVVASASGKIYVNKTGNPGMATAGCGDVLTGIIAAFLAQGLSDFDAAKYGAWLHGTAGDLAAKAKTQLALIATDLIDHIPQAVKSCR